MTFGHLVYKPKTFTRRLSRMSCAELVMSCKSGQLPSIETMSKYGLLGYNNTNPIEIFEKYKKLVQQGVSEKQIIDAEKNGRLFTLLKLDRNPVPF